MIRDLTLDKKWPTAHAQLDGWVRDVRRELAASSKSAEAESAVATQDVGRLTAKLDPAARLWHGELAIVASGTTAVDLAFDSGLAASSVVWRFNANGSGGTTSTTASVARILASLGAGQGCYARFALARISNLRTLVSGTYVVGVSAAAPTFGHFGAVVADVPEQALVLDASIAEGGWLRVESVEV